MRIAGNVLVGLDRIFHRGAVAGLSEGGLLDRFVAQGDEAAFAALVARHGPMVLGVCRRALRDEHDVEDAFQATFLVLVRRAGSIRDGELVGHWLHGVAHRVAVRARAVNARRHALERTGVEVNPAVHGPSSVDDSAVLDEELARLPESLRAPLVLCYLEGLTHDEAAQRLGWPVGTVRSRMARGRDVLQRRLTRRGVAGAAPALTPVSASLLDATVRASLGLASQKTLVITLAQGAMNAMIVSKLKTLGAAALAGLIALGGVQTFARQGGEKAVEAPAQPVDLKARLIEEIARSEIEEKSSQASLARIVAKKQALQKELADLSLAAQPDPANGPAPKYMRLGDFVLAWTPEGDKFAIHDMKSNETQSVRLSDAKDSRLKVNPILTHQLLALQIQGPKVGRIAVFNVENRTWYPQNLREPVTDATPVFGGATVVYPLGRYVYAFSGTAKRWDVLELPPGLKPNITVGFGSTNFEHDGHIYTFTAQAGKWTDFDTRTLLNAPEK